MMKKLLFALTVLALLLCTGAALADSHPCDECGGPTTFAGSGTWCHWYCETCDHTTSRNHNPNSAYSGLVPDSCSGSCSWCGAKADFSSHTFSGYVYNNDGTCTADGTETGKCTNVQCGATHTRTCPNTMIPHYFHYMIVKPTCEAEGMTVYVCQICGLREYDEYVDPLGHAFDEWVYNDDGTHTSVCANEGCSRQITEECRVKEAIVGGKTIRYCFVCNHLVSGESAVAPVSANGLMILVDAAPLDVDVETDALYMIIISCAEPLEAKVEVIIDLNEYPFEVEGDYAALLPAQLDGEKLNLFYVGASQPADLGAETWYATPFTLEEGMLTFHTADLGIYLIVPDKTAE